MSGGSYSQGKRQREAEKARKKREKAERRAMRRETGPREPEIISSEEIVGELPTIDEAMRAIDDRASGNREANAIPCRLFVGGLSWDTTVDTLRTTFTAHGPVSDAVVISDRDTGRSRGFGFVVMENRKDAAKAITALDGSELDGRNIVVNVATERSR